MKIMSTKKFLYIILLLLSTKCDVSAFSISPRSTLMVPSTFDRCGKRNLGGLKYTYTSSPRKKLEQKKASVQYKVSMSQLKALPSSCGGSSTMIENFIGILLRFLGSLSNYRNVLHGDPTFVLSAVLLLSTFGISLENRTTIGKSLSAPLATMAVALAIANFGVIPFSSPIYSMINKYLVPMAVPLLLFDSDLRRVISDTGTLLIAFIIGAVSTIVGTLVAYPLFPLTSLGPDQGWKVACALAARHIGGAINFVAVAETLNISGSTVSAAIAADNVVVALYFAFLFSLAKSGEEESSKKVKLVEMKNENAPIDPENLSLPENQRDNSITMETLGLSFAVSSCLVTLGKLLTKVVLPSGTSALPLISLLTVASATTFPAFFRRLRISGTATGILIMQMFFAASGAAGSIRLVMESAPSLFAFSFVQVATHFMTLMTAGKLFFRLDSKELYLASNANVGGPTTAAAMAQAKEWKSLVLPALLIGILGYSTATAIAIGLGPILLRLPLLN